MSKTTPPKNSTKNNNKPVNMRTTSKVKKKLNHKKQSSHSFKRNSFKASSEPVKIVLFNKPYNVLTQFTDDTNRATLADYINIKNVYAAGRLDKDSEGLLVLTNDGKLQQQITSPTFKKPKTYWVQVEGVPTAESLKALQKGVELKDGLTLPAEVSIMPEPEVWQRIPPIRERASIPTTWLRVTIKEGRNRQVRRMTAHIGHPTLRLIRASIGDWTLDTLQPGEYKIL